MDTNAINKARIIYYGLFASLFSFNLDEEQFVTIKKAVKLLLKHPIDEQSGKTLANMHRKLKNSGFKTLKNENDDIFFSPTTSLMPMTASYFYEQRDDGSKRLEMIKYVSETLYRRDNENYKEHEDHIEFILSFIQQLIQDEMNGQQSAGILAKIIFTNILNQMIDEFAETLFQHENSAFYKQAALALASFAEFERLYFGASKPVQSMRKKKAQQISPARQQSGCMRSTGCV